MARGLTALRWLEQLSRPAQIGAATAGAALLGGAALAAGLHTSSPAEPPPPEAVALVPDGEGVEGDVREMAIYLEVEPATLTPGATPFSGDAERLITLPGVPVRIHGVGTPEHAGTRMRITITPPQGVAQPDATAPATDLPEGESKAVASGRLAPEPPASAEVTVANDGTFSTAYTPNAPGEHEVVAISADGRDRGETRFDVEDPEALVDDLRAELEREAKQLVRNVHALVEAVCAKQDALPPSPARDRAKDDCAELEVALDAALPAGEAPSWVHAADHLADLSRMAPELRPPTAPLVGQLRTWRDEAARANAGAPRALAELTQGNLVCDQLDVIVNGLKFCDFYLGLISKPFELIADWAKENVPTKLIGMIPQVNRTPALQEGVESAWKGILTFQPKVDGGGLALGAEGYERASGVHKMAYDLAIYAGSRVFEAYCQEFRGPVSGEMAAIFTSSGGHTWWTYQVDMAGELTLRYPKDASGEAIALTGEFTGNATRFESWDNAIPVLFPKLAAGMMIRQRRHEPIAMPSDPTSGWNPASSMLEKGGTAVQTLLTPASFRVPVLGELRGDTIHLDLLDAAVDFDDERVQVSNVVFSVLTMRPQLVQYALPYKGARFLMGRAMNDERAEFQVKREGETMVIERRFTRERESGPAKGVYGLTVKACNPTCP